MLAIGKSMLRVPLWLYYIATVTIMFVAAQFIPHDSVFSVTSLVNNSANEVLALLSSFEKLVCTLNATIFAAAGTLAIKGREWSRCWTRFESILLVGTFAGGATSYYGVYLSSIRTINMVYYGTINPVELGMVWTMRLQYWGLLSEVVLLGVIFCRMLDSRLLIAEATK